jgi:hypothetical protein
MAKARKYYKVSIGTTDTEVSSLAKAKKLIQGQSDWKISKFTRAKDTNILKCHGVTWKAYMDLLKKQKWRTLCKLDCDRLTIALHKSRIAK